MGNTAGFPYDPGSGTFFSMIAGMYPGPLP
jgi:hypothetical protein